MLVCFNMSLFLLFGGGAGSVCAGVSGSGYLCQVRVYVCVCVCVWWMGEWCLWAPCCTQFLTRLLYPRCLPSPTPIPVGAVSGFLGGGDGGHPSPPVRLPSSASEGGGWWRAPPPHPRPLWPPLAVTPTFLFPIGIRNGPRPPAAAASGPRVRPRPRQTVPTGRGGGSCPMLKAFRFWAYS